jgi:hypothetical protein
MVVIRLMGNLGEEVGGEDGETGGISRRSW